MKVPVSLHFLSSTLTGIQSSLILLIIFSIPNSFSAFSEIYSSFVILSKIYSISATLLVTKFDSGLIGNPVYF